MLGHARSGGVAAAPAHAKLPPDSFLAQWIKLLDPVLVRCTGEAGDRQMAVERESVRLSLERLAEFPFVPEAIRARGLKLRGARFGIAEGLLDVLDPKTGEFIVEKLACAQLA